MISTRTGALTITLVGVVTLGAASWNTQLPSQVPSARWLALLPDGEAKRKFILDCTGCHQFDGRIARVIGGSARTRDQWVDAVTRMLGFAGASTGFPVIAHDRDAAATAAWLTQHLTREPTEAALTPKPGTVTEYDVSSPGDLPHDVAIDASGRVVVTGMFSHNMYVLDPESGKIDTVGIPVPNANPRAVEIDRSGHWWVVLGARHMLARYEPATSSWKTHPVGFYAHSVALDSAGGAWANGHFTKDPELVVRVDGATGERRSFTVPKHPELGDAPGGPIPYEIRVAPNGVLWMSELQGNRLAAIDPRSGRVETVDMPQPHSGPRRFDIDAAGALWIPAYAANALVRYDPASRQFRTFALPVADAVPYVARVDHRTGHVWIGTSAADIVFDFDPRAERFEPYPLPSRGALVRHLAIDPRTGDVWAAYGESPGKIPSRIARIRPRT
jgi:virginiamycin B lyase